LKFFCIEELLYYKYKHRTIEMNSFNCDENYMNTTAQQNNNENHYVLGDNEEGPRVKIQVTDENSTTFDVPKKWVDMCGLISSMLEENDEDEDEENTVIPLPNITSKDTMKKVLEYCEYHHNNKADEIPKPIMGTLGEVLCDWDKEYIKLKNDKEVTLEREVLLDLIQAANYLVCDDLLHLCCATVSQYTKGKSVEELREFFGVENDFTPEEEERIREENKWVEEAQ